MGHGGLLLTARHKDDTALQHFSVQLPLLLTFISGSCCVDQADSCYKAVVSTSPTYITPPRRVSASSPAIAPQIAMFNNASMVAHVAEKDFGDDAGTSAPTGAARERPPSDPCLPARLPTSGKQRHHSALLITDTY